MLTLVPSQKLTSTKPPVVPSHQERHGGELEHVIIEDHHLLVVASLEDATSCVAGEMNLLYTRELDAVVVRLTLVPSSAAIASTGEHVSGQVAALDHGAVLMIFVEHEEHTKVCHADGGATVEQEGTEDTDDAVIRRQDCLVLPC